MNNSTGWRNGFPITSYLPRMDARGLPVAVDTCSASPHESQLVQRLFDFMLTASSPERMIGDKAYDSDELAEDLAEAGIELIAPHHRNRRPENVTQDGRPLRRYKRRWTVERTIGWIQHFRRLANLPDTPISRVEEWLPDQWQKKRFFRRIRGLMLGKPAPQVSPDPFLGLLSPHGATAGRARQTGAQNQGGWHGPRDDRIRPVSRFGTSPDGLRNDGKSPTNSAEEPKKQAVSSANASPARS